ncbi:hypothetical protein [Sulfitobacter sp.]|uniref:hypothetical protein n=1 Tax=Sulfitobacter sp. TaxID=1903071 RepID=UPI0025F59DFE|nr:hypothetical protein [Sulfitobacter sp.]
MAAKIKPDAVYRVRLGKPHPIPGTDVSLMPRHVHLIKGAVLQAMIEEGADVRASEPS